VLVIGSILDQLQDVSSLVVAAIAFAALFGLIGVLERVR
jgi:hypothetical protein